MLRLWYIPNNGINIVAIIDLRFEDDLIRLDIILKVIINMLVKTDIRIETILFRVGAIEKNCFVIVLYADSKFRDCVV